MVRTDSHLNGAKISHACLCFYKGGKGGKGTNLRIPPILPRDQPNHRLQPLGIHALALPHPQYPDHRLGTKPDSQTALIRLHRLREMMQALR